MLWFKKKEKRSTGHRTNFQKSIDQNQSFFYSWPKWSRLHKSLILYRHKLVQISFAQVYLPSKCPIKSDRMFGGV